MDAYAIMVITEVRERLAGEGSVAERQSELVIHLKVPAWGCSSTGRARRSQRRGRGFDTLQLHESSSMDMCHMMSAQSSYEYCKQ